MENDTRSREKADQLSLLHQTGAGTLMGKLLRTFWHPVARSATVAKGKARPLRVMGEDLTLYRGDSGRAYLVGGRCAHRGTLMHTGWVQDEQIRCMYHGWRFDGAGRCTEIPAEKHPRDVPVTIAGYPVYEYAGLVFAWMGKAPAPEFNLPRKHFLEDPRRILVAQEQVWGCNWFQQIENSLDATHVSFVHTWGKSTRFDQGITIGVPELSYAETAAGVRQEARRSVNNVRVSNWTFPNNNHVLVPADNKGDPWSDISGWQVPIDDEHTMRFIIYAFHPETADQARRAAEGEDRDYNPADHHQDVFSGRNLSAAGDLQFVATQDYIAVRGQGAIADRLSENLSVSDAGIVFVRKIFLRELEEIRAGRPTKQWAMLEEKVHMPVPAHEVAA